MEYSSSSSLGSLPLERQSDGHLLLAWKAGRREAGELLFERHYARVELFFHNKVREPEELIQKTFLAALEATDRIRETASFRAYLLGIAYKVLCGHYRRLNGPRNHARLPSASIEDMGRSPSQCVSEREEERLLLDALRHLPLKMQVVLELHYWERLKTHESAQVLRWPVGTVRNQLRRARQLLGQRIRELASSGHRLNTTQTRLDDWAESMRNYAEVCMADKDR